MDFVANRQIQIKEMLAALGIPRFDLLLEAIPAALLEPSLDTDDGLSEMEVLHHLQAVGQASTYTQYQAYLGGGAYDHYIPAIVQAITQSPEFLTGYTPYQPEVSQGTLQALFEFQSAIAALTGLPVSNASVYDAAAACGESVLMALRAQKGRDKILIADTVHPHHQGVIANYLHAHRPAESLPWEALLEAIDEQTAAVLVQSPNFYGEVLPVDQLVEKAKSVGALTILSANPLSYGLFASAGELGADIAVGDTQPFGIPLQFGGPYCGYLACTEPLMRQLPGRIIGRTTDASGNEGYVMTLQAREQHIRREKARSNMCTSQSLCAIASLIAMLWYGPKGIPALAAANYRRAAYLKKGLSDIPGISVGYGEHWHLGTRYSLKTPVPTFNEFVVSFPFPAEEVHDHFKMHGILAGIPLNRWESSARQEWLVTVTETKTLKDLDRYLWVAEELRR